MGIATSKAERFATEMLKRFGILKYFDLVCDAADSDITKEELIARCLDELEVKASDAVYTGDSENDSIGACQNRMDFIAVTYGFDFNRNSCTGDHVVHVSDDVKDLMLYFNPKSSDCVGYTI